MSVATLPPLAFIGAGNMATAIIAGLLEKGSASASAVRASDPSESARSALAARYGIRASADNAEAVAGAAVVVLSVKPQVLPEVVRALGPSLPADCLVLSIAAGVTCSLLERLLPPGTRVVRAMPNTPALVQRGATGLAKGSFATAADMKLASALFSAVGVTVEVEEGLLNAVTAVSGSGPAYVFRFVEGLVAAGQRAGLPATTALVLAQQTVLGAAELLVQSGEAPEELRAKVTSKGGTTAAGLAALDRERFMEALAACVLAAAERGQTLSDEAEASVAP